MNLSQLAAANPDKPAYIMAGSGQTFTYSDLERGSNQLAQLFRSLGLVRGDHVAILLENHPLFIQICVLHSVRAFITLRLATGCRAMRLHTSLTIAAPKCLLPPKTGKPWLRPYCQTYPSSTRLLCSMVSSLALNRLRKRWRLSPGRPLATKVSVRRCCIPLVPRVGLKAYSGSCLRESGALRTLPRCSERCMGPPTTVSISVPPLCTTRLHDVLDGFLWAT